MKTVALQLAALCIAVTCLNGISASEPPFDLVESCVVEDFDREYLAPTAIQALDGGKQLLVAGSVAGRIHAVDTRTGEKRLLAELPCPVTGLAVHGETAYATTREPAGRVLVLDLPTGKLQGEIRVGHTPMAPIVSRNGRSLYVANRFDNTVTSIDLPTGEQATIEVIREPVAMALSRDGRRLFVANHLPCVRPFLDDEHPYIGAEVSVIDTAERKVIRHIELPNGSQGLRGVAMSPDGRYLAVTHIRSDYTVPTMRIENGAMNMNAVSLVDADSMHWIETVMLDDSTHGAAVPWGVAFDGTGDRLLVAHAGTHELSVIDFPALLKRVAEHPGATGLYDEADLSSMEEIRTRVRLPISGPRGLAEAGGIAYAPGYFSDDVAVVDLRHAEPTVSRIVLEDSETYPLAREGERYFNDASLCHQQWQSCASCHPDGRSDVMYWDLLNDGIGNTKNTKSLFMATLTPPAMWRGVRADAAMAVRAGIHHIQFVEPKPGQAQAIEAYLTAMRATPSPALNADVLERPKTEQPMCAKCHSPGVQRGTLSESARRGKAIFEGKAQCSTCHPHPLFTTMQQVDPGLGSGVAYDIPSLVGVWRTAPYLHSGDALSLRETITDFNFLQKRGRTKELSEEELDDLIEYLKSL